MSEKIENREIKFRAWDKKNKEMLDWNYLLGNSMEETFKFPDFILMQYTGLHDKNGKEIYKGDIVKGLHNDEEVSGFVEWMKADCSFSVEIEKDFYIGLRHFQTGIEVIGNIYENKELLK